MKDLIIDVSFVFVVRQMIFISGPVVVSPSETINFQAFLPDKQFSNAKWWKITKQSTTEIQPDTKKYLTYQKNNIHAIEIIDAEKGDSAAYQFSLDNMKSNKIHTFVDGKYSLLYWRDELNKNWMKISIALNKVE